MIVEAGKKIMSVQDKIDRLLAEEQFQDDVLNSGSLSEYQKAVLLEKYGINENELMVAQRFLFGFSFNKSEIGQEEINFSLNRLRRRISGDRVSFGPYPNRKISVVGWITRVAAVLSIPLLLATIYLYQKSQQTSPDFDAGALEVKQTNTFTAPKGAKTQIVLPDGSLVWLNSGSSISCPAKFNSSLREVSITGEAYFEVVKNEKVPMVVSAGKIAVKVYGTKFNIDAFADDGKIVTTLVEGKVSLIPEGSREEYKLEPGNKATYNELEKGEIQFTRVEDMDVYTGWKDGKLYLRNVRFVDILKKLERWYNVDIQLIDASLGEYTLYATFIDENIEQVLAILSNSIPIKVEYQNRKLQPDGTFSERKVLVSRDFDKKI
jgi:ferric-dicitrate binding protein FerR (iron transport regulator)